jgi:hypothetical protein
MSRKSKTTTTTTTSTLDLASFPVPTLSNPNAVFVDESLLLQREEHIPTTTSSSNQNIRRARFNDIRTRLAKGRNANRVAVAKEYEFKVNSDSFHKKWKSDAKAREDTERNAEATALGVPKEKLYLLDTAAFAAKARAGTASDIPIDASEAAKRFIKTESSLQETGKDALSKHFIDAERKSAKRKAKRENASDGIVGMDASTSIAINPQNIKLNNQLEKTLANDPRAQTLKQNLERGTAL